VTVPPYEDDPGSWCAYDSDGTERGLDVVEVEFEDDDGWLNLDFSFTR
jgi:hypothetical protein